MSSIVCKIRVLYKFLQQRDSLETLSYIVNLAHLERYIKYKNLLLTLKFYA